MEPETMFAAGVEACTAEAAHRRDHSGPDHDECHPHAVEVVHLGNRALAVCHDCHTDSGFMPGREAEHLALRHRRETLTESAALPTSVTAA
jgi:hypothetical protein